jgi:hypothetical protein
MPHDSSAADRPSPAMDSCSGALPLPARAMLLCWSQKKISRSAVRRCGETISFAARCSCAPSPLASQSLSAPYLPVKKSSPVSGSPVIGPRCSRKMRGTLLPRCLSLRREGVPLFSPGLYDEYWCNDAPVKNRKSGVLQEKRGDQIYTPPGRTLKSGTSQTFLHIPRSPIS